MKKELLILTLLLHVSFFSFSQSPPIPCGGDDPDSAPCPDEPVPLDGGISLLVIAGVTYGLRRLNTQDTLNKN